jgi:hypothetical protein
MPMVDGGQVDAMQRTRFVAVWSNSQQKFELWVSDLGPFA